MPRTLRVMTFNIHACIGTDGRYDLERVAGVLNAERPDLVGLQEVDRRYDARSHFEDQPARLAALTGMAACYGPTITLDPPAAAAATPSGPLTVAPRREYGNLILSRLPILSSRGIALPSRLEQRGTLEAVVDLGNGATLTFVNIHLGLGTGSAERLPQTLAVAARLDAMRQARILVGDMNVQPPSQELAPLLDRLRDVWPSAGQGDGPTIPSGEPRSRIDLVLVEPGMQPTRAWTVRTDASDHLPVVCDVGIKTFDAS